MQIRAITVGLHPGFPLKSQAIAAAGQFAARCRVACADVGVPVQTVRLATPPFPLYLGGRTEAEILKFAAEIEDCCRAHGIDYCSLGAVNLQKDAESHLLAL